MGTEEPVRYDVIYLLLIFSFNMYNYWYKWYKFRHNAADNKAKQERWAMHQHNSTDHFLQEHRFKNKAINSTDLKDQA